MKHHFSFATFLFRSHLTNNKILLIDCVLRETVYFVENVIKFRWQNSDIESVDLKTVDLFTIKIIVKKLFER